MISKAFFFKEMGAFCRKSGEAKRENALPRITVLPPLVISSVARNLPCTRENGTVGWQKAKAPGRT